MRYTFTLGEEESDIEIEAANYSEALAALIFAVGSEIEAAHYLYIG